MGDWGWAWGSGKAGGGGPYGPAGRRRSRGGQTPAAAAARPSRREPLAAEPTPLRPTPPPIASGVPLGRAGPAAQRGLARLRGKLEGGATARGCRADQGGSTKQASGGVRGCRADQGGSTKQASGGLRGCRADQGGGTKQASGGVRGCRANQGRRTKRASATQKPTPRKAYVGAEGGGEGEHGQDDAAQRPHVRLRPPAHPGRAPARPIATCAPYRNISPGKQGTEVFFHFTRD